ncbi:MAG: hypothetical protein WBF89_20635 [Steroidobacteraceae bacterium]
MFRWLVRLLYDSTPAEFRSPYNLAESVERLSAASKRSAFSALAETTAVGKVSEKAVRLQRVIPMVRNSFKPFFIGRFELRGDGVVLIGKFTMVPLVKVFMSFWFGMCGLFAGEVLLSGFKPHAPKAVFFLLQPFLMIAAGIALVAAGKWFARNDAAWLSGVIATALGTPRDRASVYQPALNNADVNAVPTPLKIVAILLAVSGAMALVVGVVGPHLWPSLARSGEGTASSQLDNLNFVYAILVIALSIGIWSRRVWAWWCGFLLLGLSVCWSLFAMLVRVDAGPPVGLKLIFAILSCVVAGTWARWWYAQRQHFLWTRKGV